ncbi:unnamed protein product [Arabidopsis halleri]
MSDGRYRHHEAGDPCRATLQQLHLRTYIRTIDRRKASLFRRLVSEYILCCDYIYNLSLISQKSKMRGRKREGKEPMMKIWGFNSFDRSYSDESPSGVSSREPEHFPGKWRARVRSTPTMGGPLARTHRQG